MLRRGSLHGSLAGASLPELAAQENADGEDEDQETHGHRGHRRPQLAAAGLVPGEVIYWEDSRGLSRPTRAYITDARIRQTVSATPPGRASKGSLSFVKKNRKRASARSSDPHRQVPFVV